MQETSAAAQAGLECSGAGVVEWPEINGVVNRLHELHQQVHRGFDVVQTADFGLSVYVAIGDPKVACSDS